MSFTIFPRNAKYGTSSWNRQVVLNKPTTELTTSLENIDNNNNNNNNDNNNTAEAQNEALVERRSMKIELDDSLFKSLQQQVGHDRLTKYTYSRNNTTTDDTTDTMTDTTIPAITTDTTTLMATTENNDNNNNKSIRKLKSSLKIRQVASEPSSPKKYNDHHKTVKFDPVYLERICFFEGSHSPNEIQRFDEKNKYPSFKIKYSSHWPTSSSSLLYQHQHHNKNIQLNKKSFKILEDGACLYGQVTVKNMGYEKLVEIRYTLDGWHTFDNVQAQYQYSKGNHLDVFNFDVNIEPAMEDRGYVRCTVDMAIRYLVKTTNEKGDQVEEEYWDNNNGYNYQIQIVEDDQQKQHHHHEKDKKGDYRNKDNHMEEDDNHHNMIQKPTLKSIKSPSLNRYDFSQSLQKAKTQSKLSPSSSPTTTTTNPSLPDLNTFAASPIPIQRFHRLSLKPTFEEHIPLSISNYSINNSSERRKAHSAPSSPQQSSLLDFFSSSPSSTTTTQQQLHPSLPSISYNELVNRYCFYGSQNPQSSALPIH
ncbi:unnamed protein product [Cunninghamella blakesleeana]